MTKTIVILHGWGLSGGKYHTIRQILIQHGYQVFAPDLPGSGSVELLKHVMTIDDYIQYVLAFLKEQQLTSVILIGHSFGGRIAAKLAANHPEFVEKLILTGAPLIKKPLPVKKKLLSISARIGKRFLHHPAFRKIFYYAVGEWDYYRANPNIRETFKAIIAEDIFPHLAYITVPTCIIWGAQDTFIGKQLGKEIAKVIPHATYIEIPDATHKLPYEHPEEFAGKVLTWLQA